MHDAMGREAGGQLVPVPTPWGSERALTTTTGVVAVGGDGCGGDARYLEK